LRLGGLEIQYAKQEAMTQRDFISKVIMWCSDSNSEGKSSTEFPFQSKHMTWAHQLKMSLAAIGIDKMTVFSIETRLEKIFKDEQIEIIPGLYRGSLTGRQWMKMIEAIPDAIHSRARQTPRMIAAYDHSILREATPINLIHTKVNGVKFPLSALPELYQDGRKEFVTQYFDSADSKKQSIGNVLLRLTENICIENEMDRLFLTIAFFLQLRRPLPSCNGEDQHPKYRSHKVGHVKSRWIFMFMFLMKYWKNSNGVTPEPGASEAPWKTLHPAVARIHCFIGDIDC
jgi:hypothetical protein